MHISFVENGILVFFIKGSADSGNRTLDRTQEKVLLEQITNVEKN